LRFHGKPQQVCIVNNNIQAYLAQKCEGKTWFLCHVNVINIHIFNSNGAERESAECYIIPGYTWVTWVRHRWLVIGST
jgi:hypothetical protein